MDTDGACIVNNWADDKIQKGKWLNKNMFKWMNNWADDKKQKGKWLNKNMFK